MIASLGKLPLAAKVALGAAGAILVAGGAVAVTALAAGVTILPTTQAPGHSAVAKSTPAPSQAPAMKPPSAVKPAAAIRLALLNGEAQVLGLDPKTLAKDLRGGMTLQQLARSKNLDEPTFRSRLIGAVKPQLDREVAQGMISQKQEDRVLKSLQAGVPNWSGPAKPKKTVPTGSAQ